jgi:molecular chaperone HtpG
MAMEKIAFNIDTQKILKLLANDIYDSPYALLRENVQNAYDAILMRLKKESFEPKIDITVEQGQVIISDNGIGMTMDVIENNYWKAGSSGKNNPEARAAGVVGTFGIGAMANFGICTALEIVTRYYAGDTTYRSVAIREKLEVGKDCIDREETERRLEPGTTVKATLDEGVRVNLDEATNYLQQFVKYLKVPVVLNGTIISQNPYFNKATLANDDVCFEHYEKGEYGFDLDIYIAKHSEGRVAFYMKNIQQNGKYINGSIYLEQNNGTGIQGLRNGFGLASLPIGTNFNLGGVVDLSILVPTAGRDSISVETVNRSSLLINYAEDIVAEVLAKKAICDNNRQFLNYIQNRRRYDLAGRIRVANASGVNEYMELGTLKPEMNGKKVYYYSGTDQGIIGQYSGENNILVTLSKDYPRRNIQQEMLRRAHILQVNDNATVLKLYDKHELAISEFAFILRVMSTLKDDYLILDSKISFAKISHGVTNLVKKEGDVVCIYISRDSNNVKQVLNMYDMEPHLFDGFVKDYIRNYLYQQIAQYVPSSTREGADQLYRMLQRTKELYTIEKFERGEMEGLMEDYIQGKRKLQEVIRVSDDMQKTHRQTVNQHQVGDMEREIPSITQTNTITEETPKNDPGLPMPPIKVLANDTKMKILKTSQPYPQLNNFTHFIALSDVVFDKQLDFFLDPHTTKVMWGMHKIVYIFTHASGQLTLYYEIELKNYRLADGMTGGQQLPTTTVLSKNRIFVPIEPSLIPYFDFKEEKLEFYVRYDLISDLNERGKKEGLEA